MRRPSKDAAAFLPLKQSAYRVLLAFADGEWLHGYAIMQEVARITNGATKLGPGGVYTTIGVAMTTPRPPR